MEEHFLADSQNFNAGSFYSVDPEFLALFTGRFVASQNMREFPKDGRDGTAVEIPGEALRFNVDPSPCMDSHPVLDTGYKGMFAAEVNGYLFEVWAPKSKDNVTSPVIFRVNGVVVAASQYIPFSIDYPIQGHVNELCLGGDVVLTDYHSQPQIYNVKDLLENRGMNFDTGLADEELPCSTKYFAGYKPDAYVLNLKTVGDTVVFVQISSTVPAAAYGGTATPLGAGGMRAGEYQYAFAFGTASGDKTLWCKPTPPIPVPEGLGKTSTNYPGMKTYGAAPGAITPNGIHFRFRVNNPNNYKTCHIRRISYNIGAPYGSVGIDELIYSFDISPGEATIRDFWDIGATGTLLTDDDRVVAVGEIDTAKTPRFFDSRLHLMNVNYKSRDASGVGFLTGSNDQAMWPVIDKIGKQGHKDPWNATYKKTLMNNEKYGWAIIFRDHQNSILFGIPISGGLAGQAYGGDFVNYQMPSRRDTPVSTDDETYTPGTGPRIASNVNLHTGHTFEVFEVGVHKTDNCHFKNILDADDTTHYKDVADVVVVPCMVAGLGQSFDDGTHEGGQMKVGWQPFRPTKETDGDVDGTNFNVNLTIEDHSTHDDYLPQGFAPDYFTLGMALAGLISIPNFVASFSIVRTLPARRVFGQGLIMYSLTEAVFDASSVTQVCQKALNEVWFYMPDHASGLANFEDVMNNPANYQVQLVSPLGFFSEVYNGLHADANNRDANIDMISYARVLFDDGRINPGSTNIGNDADGYVGFGDWQILGTDFATLDPANKGNHLFNIVSITPVVSKSGRQGYFKIVFDEDIYASTDSGAEFSDTDSVHFAEPFYVANIIVKNAGVDISANQQVYVETGHLQKLDSIIGVSDGGNNGAQGYLLVDERKDDVFGRVIADNRFVWLEMEGVIVGKYIDVTLKGGLPTVLIDADIADGTNTSGANGDGLLIGKYSARETVMGDHSLWSVDFTNGQIPITGNEIHVLYDPDPSAPEYCFGGDQVHGEAVFAPIDCDQDPPLSGPLDGTANQPAQFALSCAWPYSAWGMNPRNYVLRDAVSQGLDPASTYYLAYIRQMLVMFTCTSRTSIPYSFNVAGTMLSCFPSVNYVMRPSNWDKTLRPSQQHIFKDYETTYPEELDVDLLPIGWGTGGFRINQLAENINVDYSQYGVNIQYFGKPFGFVEVLKFCVRDIWSARRDPNVFNDPGIKTFLPLAFIDLDEINGEITKAFSANTSNGNNLYAYTESGLCMILNNRFIARQITGAAIGTLGTETGTQNIFEKVWLSNKEGLPRNMWRTFAENDNENYITNDHGSFKFTENHLVEIAKGGYHFRLFNDFIQQALAFNDDLCAHYDILHDEYWVSKKKRAHFYNSGDDDTNIAHATSFKNEVGGIHELYGDTIDTFVLPSATLHAFSLWVVNNTSETVTIKNLDGDVIDSLDPGQVGYYVYADGVWALTVQPGSFITYSWDASGPALPFTSSQIIINGDPVSTRALMTTLDDLVTYLNAIGTDVFTLDGTTISVVATSMNIYGDITVVNADDAFVLSPSFGDLHLSALPGSAFDPMTLSYLDSPEYDKHFWQDVFLYDGDQFVAIGNLNYQLKNGDTYELAPGSFLLNNEMMERFLVGATVGGQNATVDKEFCRIHVNGDKPTYIAFYDSLDDLRSDTPSSIMSEDIQGPLYVKDYRGWEQGIPRRNLKDLNRQQGRVLLYKISNTSEGRFQIKNVVNFFKKIK